MFERDKDMAAAGISAWVIIVNVDFELEVSYWDRVKEKYHKFNWRTVCFAM